MNNIVFACMSLFLEFAPCTHYTITSVTVLYVSLLDGWYVKLIVLNFQVTNAESDLQKKKELLKESEGSEVLKGDEVSLSLMILCHYTMIKNNKMKELKDGRMVAGET